MGVVNKRCHLLVRRGEKLHAPGHLGARERPHDVLLRDAQQLADGNGGQRVVHVEEARHGEHAAALPTGGVGNKLHVAIAGLDV